MFLFSSVFLNFLTNVEQYTLIMLNANLESTVVTLIIKNHYFTLSVQSYFVVMRFGLRPLTLRPVTAFCCN